MTKINAPTKRSLVITGADPKTIEKEVYSKDKIESAIAKINENKEAENDFGDSNDTLNGDWGSVKSSDSEDENDSDEPW